MANYQFEIVMAVSEIIDVEADDYNEACNQARYVAEGDYYCVTPEGYSIPWDNVDYQCIDSDAEDW